MFWQGQQEAFSSSSGQSPEGKPIYLLTSSFPWEDREKENKIPIFRSFGRRIEVGARPRLVLGQRSQSSSGKQIDKQQCKQIYNRRSPWSCSNVWTRSKKRRSGTAGKCSPNWRRGPGDWKENWVSVNTNRQWNLILRVSSSLVFSNTVVSLTLWILDLTAVKWDSAVVPSAPRYSFEGRFLWVIKARLLLKDINLSWGRCEKKRELLEIDPEEIKVKIREGKLSVKGFFHAFFPLFTSHFCS